MINPLVVASAGDDVDEPYQLDLPAAGLRTGPLVFGSPHSGRIYPQTFMAATDLDEHAIRGSEDAFVDQLIASAPGYGIPIISARFARAYLDVNREPWELDPRMFADELPSYARARSARVNAGLGAIARIVREGQEIYARKLTFAEAAERVNGVHAPYHAALRRLVDQAKAAHGVAILLDWHSMPREATAANASEPKPDIVLGDRFGAACSPAIVRRIEAGAFEPGVSGGAEHALRRRLHHRALRQAPDPGARPADRDQPRALPGGGDPESAARALPCCGAIWIGCSHASRPPTGRESEKKGRAPQRKRGQVH